MVVAMMVFAVLSLGVAYSMLAVLQTSRDSRGRQVAANLAAQEIDLVRSVENVNDLGDEVTLDVVDGITYTIDRTTSWIDRSGTDVGCSTSGGALQFKRVNVTVTWPGHTEEDGRTPVRADTIVAPSSKINEPTRGTILIKVVGRTGEGMAGVPVTVSVGSPAGDAVSLEQQPAVTDSQGCTYAFKVVAGNYRITLAKPGYIDVRQRSAPVTDVTVTAGASVAASFEYDARATTSVTLASNHTTTRIPTNLPLTMFSSFENYIAPTSAISGTGKTRTIQLYPFSSGYEAVAGAVRPVTETSAGCLSPDPRSWEPSGVAAGPFASEPATNASVAVPMGLVQVTTTASFTGVVTAQSAVANPATGDPGCAITMSLSFADRLPSSGSVVLALPYGSWKVTAGTSTMGVASGSTVQVPAGGGVVGAGGVVTLVPPGATP
jgi:hypothetical protein